MNLQDWEIILPVRCSVEGGDESEVEDDCDRKMTTPNYLMNYFACPSSTSSPSVLLPATSAQLQVENEEVVENERSSEANLRCVGEEEKEKEIEEKRFRKAPSPPIVVEVRDACFDSAISAAFPETESEKELAYTGWNSRSNIEPERCTRILTLIVTDYESIGMNFRSEEISTEIDDRGVGKASRLTNETVKDDDLRSSPVSPVEFSEGKSRSCRIQTNTTTATTKPYQRLPEVLNKIDDVRNDEFVRMKVRSERIAKEIGGDEKLCDIWKWSLSGVRAICSFGVAAAAATFCAVVLLGSHGHQKHQMKMSVKICRAGAHDKRLRVTFLRHHVTM